MRESTDSDPLETGEWIDSLRAVLHHQGGARATYLLEMLDPQIVLFDEPDSGLDPVRTALLCELIKEVHDENGGTYVVITHDIASARRTPEYMAILWRGKIVEAGLREDLFASENKFVRQFLAGDSAGPLGME